MRPAEAALSTSDERVLAYLADEMTAEQRRDFEQDLQADPALRREIKQWVALAQARQLAHNEQDRPARFDAIMEHVRDGKAAVAPQAPDTDSSEPAPITHTSKAGAPAQQPRAASPQPAKSGGWLRRLFMGSGSPGLGLPLGWVTAAALAIVMVMPAPPLSGDDPAGQPGSGPLTRGGDATCPRLRVNLPDDLTTSRLRETLTQYAVALVAGPDADGYFVFTAKRESSLADAARALGATTAAPIAAGTCPTP